MGAFNWTLKNLYRAGDNLHLLHVVPDVFSSPASGAIYYPATPDTEEVEQALVRGGGGAERGGAGAARSSRCWGRCLPQTLPLGSRPLS